MANALSEQDNQVLRWAGLAGIAGSLLLIGVFVLAGVVVGLDDVSPVQMIERFPSIHWEQTLENGIWLAVLMLWMLHFIGLYRALRNTSVAPALFGSALGIAGVVLLAAGALPHIATLPLSDLYQSAEASAADKAALALMFKATWSVMEAPFVAGLCVLPFGILLLGTAMLGNTEMGKVAGWTSIAFGLIGAVGAIVALIDPASPAAAGALFTTIFFHLLAGWRLVRLSGAQ